jgi:hypothetical protein
MFLFLGFHQRQRRFRLQDHLYHIKISLKQPDTPPPLLSDLLHLFQEGFRYILTNLSTFYNPEDHNVTFLTLYQEPMINALNTGAFDLQEGINDMVERILKMLQQFLISNNSLRLNNTFKVYVKILSIEHMRFNERRKKKPNPQKKYRKRYGISHQKEEHKTYWLLNVPNGYGSKPNIFKNKCLVTATILGHLQNAFYKSNRKDKRYVYVQNVNSKIETKKLHACKLLANELNDLIQNTSLPSEGPYELEKTAKILSEYFKCQFFIFDAIDNSNKLNFMYPNAYDDSLEPIYLFQPLNEPNHLIFIRHLNSYFKANLKICFYCKKTFRSYRYNHFCVKKKGCFACHRAFAKKSTFLHSFNKTQFCDRKISSESSKICNICNVTIYTEHCRKGHKLLCCGQGSFGWKCLKCNKFSYRYGKLNSTLMKEIHQCGVKKCIYCYQNMVSEYDHLCKLKIEKFPNMWPLIAFIAIEHSNISIENCLQCMNIKKEYQNNQNFTYEELQNSEHTILTCDNHKNTDIFCKPLLIIIYKEVKRGSFKKYVLTSSDFYLNDFTEDNFLNFEYVSENLSNIYEKARNDKNSLKKSYDFSENLKKLQSTKSSDLSVMNKFIKLITHLEWQNTTFVSQDGNSQNYNSILSGFLENGFCPKVIQNGRKILFMEIENLNLRFVMSNSYIEGSEFDLAQQYSLMFEPYFFPESLKIPTYYHYDNEVPDVKYFYSFNDSTNIKKEKEQFVKNLKKQNYKWNFEKELFRFCDEKLWFLSIACTKIFKGII